LQSTQQELEELVRTRTEIACVIADLRSSGEGSADKRQSQEVELNRVQQLIAQREAELQQVVPQWNAQRASEAAGKRQLDEANAKMGALFSKQGRATKFRTRAERDAYLRSEIESVRSYHAAQTTALGKAHEDLAAAQQRLQELTDRIAEVRERMENSKAHSRNLEVDIIRLKEEQLTAMENRKDLWREDTKLDSLTAHAHTELSSAERVLTSMMDKVGLGSIDSSR
jgi:structural maintenance of chromosome 3 (chondroitin sulfate proteoglycan 6)